LLIHQTLGADDEISLKTAAACDFNYPRCKFKVRLTKNGKPYWTMAPEELTSQISPEDD